MMFIIIIIIIVNVIIIITIIINSILIISIIRIIIVTKRSLWRGAGRRQARSELRRFGCVHRLGGTTCLTLLV